MNIQKRVYKYNEPKTKIQSLITGLANHSNLSGRWVDENNFILKRKSPFTLFHVEGDISETEDKNKLSILITTDYKFLLLFILPIGLVLYGAFKWFKGSEKGIFLAFAGVSIFLLIFFITSYNIEYLKKNFKEAFNLM